jgi:NAD(P)-dependent dehydrogenase (short-subunit alcohol dehydrogenase family)
MIFYRYRLLQLCSVNNDIENYYKTMKKLENRVAVITGGNSGIGLATAKEFVAQGAYVFITGRRQAELDKAVKEIGSNVTAVQGDVSNLDDLDRLYKTVKEEKGSVDILVANAGMVELVTLGDATPEHFDKIFNINARGVFFTAQKALPLMKNGGSIVLVSSGLHSKGLAKYGVYAATKAALRSFARTWAVELKDRQIRVNTLSPGPIDTPIISAQFPNPEAEAKGREFFKSIVPLNRLGDPEETAKAALFLASSDSSYITATDLVVDGGLTQI